MQTRLPQRRTLVAIVAFALTCTTLMILTWISFGGATPLRPHGYSLVVPLPNAENLLKGEEVKIAGVHVGHIRDVRRDGRGALAVVEIDAKYAPIRAGAVATVRAKTLLGEAYLEMTRGDDGEAAIPDGGSLAASRVRPAVRFDEVLDTFDSPTRRRTRELVAGLAAALDDRGPSVNASLGYAAPFATNLADVMNVLDEQRGQLVRLVANAGDVLAALGERTGALSTAVTAGNEVLKTTAERDRELAETVSALPGFLRQLRSTSGTLANASGDIERGIDSLVPVASRLPSVLTNITRNGPAFASVLRRLPSTVAAARRGLPALTQLVRAAPSALRPLYPALRELIPVIELFATYRNGGVVGALANAGSLYNGVSVVPGGKIVHRASASLFLGNESIGGYVKRLPTHRSNPYPTPDGLLSMARNGFLKSYDCRNVGNPNIVPALGTGVPSCVEQGPWDYNGVTAYYPRLRQAPP